MYLNDYLVSKHGTDDASKGSRDSRLSRRLAVGMDGSVSGQEDTDRSFTSSVQGSYLGEEEGEEAVLVLNDDEYSFDYIKPKSNKKRCILIAALVIFVVAIIIGVIVPLITKENSDQAPVFFSGATTQLEACQAGFFQDTKELQLEIHMRGISEELASEESISLLEAAIAVGYNEASGGCADEYQRIMYDATLKDQRVVHDLVLARKESAENLETVFQDVSIMIAQFQTKISCDGCPDDEAFASVYPAIYGGINGNRKKRRELNSESKVFPNDSLVQQPELSTRRLDRTLDAGEVIVSIEKAVRSVINELDGFQEVTILARGADGSSAAVTLHEQTDSNEEVYKPSFFRNKALEDARQFRDCDMAKKRKKSSKSSKSSSSPSKSARAPTTSPSGSAPTKSPSPAPTKSTKAPSVKSGKGTKAPTNKSGKGTKAPSVATSKTSKSSKSCNVEADAAGIESTASAKATKAPSVKGSSMKGTKAPIAQGVSAKGTKAPSSKGGSTKGTKAPNVTGVSAKGTKAPNATGVSTKATKAPSTKGSSTKGTKAPSSKGSTSKSGEVSPPDEGDSEAPGERVPVTTTEGRIGEHPACEVCGNGKTLTIPGGTFVPPGMQETQCLALQLAGINGFIPADSCPQIPALITGPCGCV